MLEEKVPCKLIGVDSNIFNLLGRAQKVLRKAGQNEAAEEMVNRIMKGEAESYEHALNILQEYVEIR